MLVFLVALIEKPTFPPCKKNDSHAMSGRWVIFKQVEKKEDILLKSTSGTGKCVGRVTGQHESLFGMIETGWVGLTQNTFMSKVSINSCYFNNNQILNVSI